MKARGRTARRFGIQYVLRNLLLAIPPAIAFVVMWGHRQPTGRTTWLAAAFFVLWIAGWIVADAAWFRRFRCPACGARIRRPTIARRGPDDPIAYRCERCDVEWDTGLREPAD